MKSPNFNAIKDAYNRGSYSDAIMRILVEKGLITEDEYKEIVGEKVSNV